MQIKGTSGQRKIMSSAPKYIAQRSVWWQEGTKAVIRRLHLSKQVSVAESIYCFALNGGASDLRSDAAWFNCRPGLVVVQSSLFRGLTASCTIFRHSDLSSTDLNRLSPDSSVHFMMLSRQCTLILPLRL